MEQPEGELGGRWGMFQAEDSRNHCGQTLEGTDKYMLSCSYLKVRKICFLWYTLNPPSSLFKNLIWSTFSYFFTLLEFLVIYQTLSVIHYINCGFHYLPLRYVCLVFFFFLSAVKLQTDPVEAWF